MGVLGEVDRQRGTREVSKSDSNEIPTRSGQPRLLAGGREHRGRTARPFTDPAARTDRRTEGQANPSKGLTFRVGADEDPDAAAGGHEVRRQGGEVPGERRPPERRVAGAGQLGARAGRPHRPLEAQPPPPPPPSSAPRAPARGPRNSEGDPRRRRGSEPLRARGAAGELPGTHRRPARSGHTDLGSGLSRRRLLPLGASASARGRSSVRQPVGAGGPRAGGYERGAPLRWEAPAPAAESAAISPPAPAAGGGGWRGGGTERARGAEQTLWRKGVRSLSGSCLPRLTERRGWGLGLPGGFPGFAGGDPERSRLPPWPKAGKTLAREDCCSARSPKGQRSPEDFSGMRACRRQRVFAQVPGTRPQSYTHAPSPDPRGEEASNCRTVSGRLGGSVPAAPSRVAQVVLSFRSSRSERAAKPRFL